MKLPRPQHVPEIVSRGGQLLGMHEVEERPSQQEVSVFFEVRRQDRVDI